MLFSQQEPITLNYIMLVQLSRKTDDEIFSLDYKYNLQMEI